MPGFSADNWPLLPCQIELVGSSWTSFPLSLRSRPGTVCRSCCTKAPAPLPRTTHYRRVHGPTGINTFAWLRWRNRRHRRPRGSKVSALLHSSLPQPVDIQTAALLCTVSPCSCCYGHDHEKTHSSSSRQWYHPTATTPPLAATTRNSA